MGNLKIYIFEGNCNMGEVSLKIETESSGDEIIGHLEVIHPPEPVVAPTT